MTLLVIGGGYVGLRVARAWHEQGHEVHVTTRFAERALEFSQLGLLPILCNVLHPETLSQLPKAEIVLHSVAIDRKSGNSMADVYIQGLRNVLPRIAGCGRFLYVSSTSVYGQQDGSWVTEESKTEPSTESGKILLEAERSLRDMDQALILRFAGIYGPGRIPYAETIRQGNTLSPDPAGWLNLIHVEDGIAAIQKLAIGSGTESVYNIVDKEPMQRRDYWNLLASLLCTQGPLSGNPHEGSALARRRENDLTNRRVSSELLQRKFAFQFRYPTYREGLPGSMNGVG
jgi:nucleoside-diphosphate-sugar epimerase